MRQPSLVWTLVIGLLAASGAGAQEARDLEPDRGPRFLLASAIGPERRPVDIQRTPSLRRRIAVRFEDVTLKAALDEISRLGGLRLTYSRQVVPLDHRPWAHIPYKRSLPAFSPPDQQDRHPARIEAVGDPIGPALV